MEDLDHVAAVVVGVSLAGTVLFSALQTVVLPRGGLTGITRFVFASADRIFESRGQWRPMPRRFSALYAPVALVSLPFAWCMLVTLAFALIFWGLNAGSPYESFVISGSSLFTLGFAKPDGAGLNWLTFVEATIGLGLVALLISFLPTLYAAYSDRERGVGLLEPLVGDPPTAVELLQRLHFADAIDGTTIWGPASQWFVALAQSHSAFPALCSFPSQQPGLSWVVTAGTVLDAAALRLSVYDATVQPLDGPLAENHRNVAAPVLVLAHGIPALTRVGRSAGLDVPEPPNLVELLGYADRPLPSISITRTEYEDALDALARGQVIGDVDRERGWQRFVWLRSGYDEVTAGLAGYTRAPVAPWTSDRALRVGRPRFFGNRPLTAEPHR